MVRPVVSGHSDRTRGRGREPKRASGQQGIFMLCIRKSSLLISWCLQPHLHTETAPIRGPPSNTETSYGSCLLGIASLLCMDLTFASLFLLSLTLSQRACVHIKTNYLDIFTVAKHPWNWTIWISKEMKGLYIRDVQHFSLCKICTSSIPDHPSGCLDTDQTQRKDRHWDLSWAIF